MSIPSDEEALASGQATRPEDMPVEEIPVAEDRIRPRDRVQCRRVLRDEAGEIVSVAVHEFVASAVKGSKVTGPEGDFDEGDGWLVETIERAPLELPETRAAILATLSDGSVVELVGKKQNWMNDDGDLVDVGLIVSFELA